MLNAGWRKKAVVSKTDSDAVYRRKGRIIIKKGRIKKLLFQDKTKLM